MQWSLSATRCRFPHPLSMRCHLYLESLSKTQGKSVQTIQIDIASHICPENRFIHSRVHSRVQNNLLTDFCSWRRQIPRTWWRWRPETQIWSPVKTFIVWSSSSLSKNWSPHRITRRPTCRTHSILSHWQILESTAVSGQMKLLSLFKNKYASPNLKSRRWIVAHWTYGQSFLGSTEEDPLGGVHFECTDPQPKTNGFRSPIPQVTHVFRRSTRPTSRQTKKSAE